jgi:TatD DNase family protein
MFVDTHAHLFYKNFEGELEEVIARAREALVDFILVPGTDIETSKQTVELTRKYDFIYGAVGVHPQDTKDWDDSYIHQVEELAHESKIVAIGEIGLDYYYDFSPKEKQIKAFTEQIELALKLDLPVIIHNREADEDVMNILASYAGSGLRAQLHCFNGTVEDALKLIKMHHYISFTGNITFKNAENLRQVLAAVTPEHLLIETDSPFMTPVPFRGKRNEPYYVKYVAEQAAAIHKMSIEDIGRITSLNAFRLFGIGSKSDTKFTYKIHDSLYVNVTNRCNADCIFCSRKEDPVISGYNLKMNKSDEPPAELYIKEIGDPKQYHEIVFCGYGEPSIRWDVVKQVAAYVKENGGKTRMNTNGHGNYINKRDITPELKGKIDTVSISFNATDAGEYARIMKVDPSMYDEMKNFARKAKDNGVHVVLSVVSIDEVEIEKARKIVTEEIGVEFRVREYF